MKLREVTQETKQKYLNEVAATVQNYDDMIKAIDTKFSKYGLLHYQQTQNVLNLAYAKEKKEELRAEIKNINITTLDTIAAQLKDIKERYIKEVTPSTAITDPLELDFIEKELKVMTDKELLDYYKENYLDTNIVRLCNIEHKARSGYREGKAMMSLPDYGVEDDVTKKIDSEIKRTIGMRQVVGTMCAFVGRIDETGTPVPKLISWNTVFEEIENRNLHKFLKVSLTDFIQKTL